MNRTQQLINYICERRNPLECYIAKSYLYLQSNKIASITLHKYLHEPTENPLVIYGRPGSGKSHIVCSKLLNHGLRTPEVSAEFLLKTCSRIGLKPDEIDTLLFRQNFPIFYIDSATELMREDQSRWMNFFTELAKTGSKVILTTVEIFDSPQANFKAVRIYTPTESDAIRLAKQFFHEKFGYEAMDDDDLLCCTEVLTTNFSSPRNIERYIHTASLTHKRKTPFKSD